jgi:threonine/homoserine/homoserine lactone efflux protein
MQSLDFLFGSAFLIGLSGAMMPGPMLTATIADAMRRGFWAGPLIVLGHAALELTLLTAMVAGLAPWLRNPLFLGILGVGGGLLLLRMAVGLARDARAIAETLSATDWKSPPAAKGRLRSVTDGILLSLSNPYWTLWWATIGLNYMGIAARRGLPGFAAFYTGHILSDLAWFTLVATAVAAGRRICPPQGARTILRICAALLAGLGALFIGEGAGRLTGVG